MDSLLLQLGVGGIFAVMVIREVLAWITKRSKEDDGFPSWLRIQLQQAISQMSKDMGSQTDSLKQIAAELKDINRTLGDLSGDYRSIQERMEHLDQTLEKFADRRLYIRDNGQ